VFEAYMGSGLSRRDGIVEVLEGREVIKRV
jgi:hypothetical protein